MVGSANDIGYLSSPTRNISTFGYKLEQQPIMKPPDIWDAYSLPGNQSALLMAQFNTVVNATMISSEEVIKQMNASQFHILLPSLVLVCVLLVLGIPGNLIAVLVYAMKMKRSTAGYFIMTLAISDLINCVVSLPVEIALIADFWTFDYPLLCKFSRYMSAAMNNTSSFILAAIAVERFRSICLPLRPKCSNLRAKVACAVIVLCAICSAIPMIICYGTFTHNQTVNDLNITIQLKTCLVDDAVVNTGYPLFILIYFFVGHLTVFMILGVLYSCIAYRLIKGIEFSDNKNGLLQRQGSAYSMTSYTAHFTTKTTRQLSLESDAGNSLRPKCQLVRTQSTNSNFEMNMTRRHGGQAFRTRRLTCMLFLVASVFEISFIPYLVIVSIRNHHPDYFSQLPLFGQMVYQFFLRFYLINCAVNPIIYCFYNQNFRHGVKRLFRSIRDTLQGSDS
ncbi:cholecystokinin receptor type A-like [Mya arenaria]|uniref:cholecystokinin receptor type A-like n=1 Tax=Mya arenaria TaxID=6604 RepID=UPI0022E46089|nr:cholecystokinin receptor type A-like [Mya arenaria]XP_052812253.1 cholecystokinin receptor type A-like [Mya arenaria]XP_052812254.1 cholecystokinin receptor type A-like [Mya arenaria]XP_052812255.1 cholecystokinin receptor type A-like [Mya arenaria]XP_052812256.1 cholecystokinin receptor type A-like [Mya arenaria]XP_052812258.1 cholecystokinin receptor type A-like [Mya arenaria]XP_052812259.1 cholecystokinin receptor type A-like [Mya arenaria]